MLEADLTEASRHRRVLVRGEQCPAAAAAGDHSILKARIGSSREARHDGSRQANPATRSSVALTVTKTPTSNGAVWYNMEPIRRTAAADRQVPESVRARLAAGHPAAPAEAPAGASAMRMPISPVRWVTRYQNPVKTCLACFSGDVVSLPGRDHGHLRDTLGRLLPFREAASEDSTQSAPRRNTKAPPQGRAFARRVV